MFELFIATVLVDGSQNETALNYVSMLEFERIHKCSILETLDKNLHAEHLATLAWLAHKQRGQVPSIEEFPKQLKAVSYRVERVPFGEQDSPQQSQG